ncbi:MAG: M42 family metallopeptidase [Anaerolineales bacterium]
MPSPVDISANDLTKDLVELLNIPSPTGYCADAIRWASERLVSFGLQPKETAKGGLLVSLGGDESRPKRALTAHVDTLGAMVKEILPNGRLRLRAIGGIIWNSVETEGCTVFCRNGRRLRGSLMIDRASAHVHGKEAGQRERKAEHMELRLDERTQSAEDAAELGVSVGDFVAFDPRVEVSESGFIRSRFLDDKAGVVCLLAAVKALRASGESPVAPTWIHISNYEEVGHGAAADLPEDLAELIAVDMAAVGKGQASSEFETTICLMDSGGPYHHGLSQHLRRLAEAKEIPHQVDMYPSYRSDGSAHWFAGGGAQVALMGPGIDASHNYERTHQDSLVATTRLILAYLITER